MKWRRSRLPIHQKGNIRVFVLYLQFTNENKGNIEILFDADFMIIKTNENASCGRVMMGVGEDREYTLQVGKGVTYLW